MNETELVAAGRKLYEQILAVPFSPEEMLAFGQAVFNKTPWGALMPAGKIAMFRLAAAIAPPLVHPEQATAPGPIPEAEIVDAQAGTSDAKPRSDEAATTRSESAAADPAADVSRG